MACGCRKNKKAATVVEEAVPSRAAVLDALVEARCLNCTGLLYSLYVQDYLVMNTGAWYTVSFEDITRWRYQGWVIETR